MLRISELVAKLEAIKAKHGDIEVAAYQENMEDEGGVDTAVFCAKGKFEEHFYCKSGDYDDFNARPLAVIISDAWDVRRLEAEEDD